MKNVHIILLVGLFLLLIIVAGCGLTPGKSMVGQAIGVECSSDYDCDRGESCSRGVCSGGASDESSAEMSEESSEESGDVVEEVSEIVAEEVTEVVKTEAEVVAVGDGTGNCAAGLSPCGPNKDCVATASDPSNCGACGDWCFDSTKYPGVKNAECIESVCVMKECNKGFIMNKNGLCEKECKDYTRPGKYLVNKCDTFSYKGYRFTVGDIGENSVGGDFIINDTYFINWGLAIPKYPYFSFGGLNLMLLNTSEYVVWKNDGGYTSTYNALISMDNSCEEMYNYCLSDLKNKPIYSQNYYKSICEFICKPQDKFHNTFRDSAFTKNIIVSVPKGYTLFASLVATNAQNCYNKILNITGVEAKIPIYINYNFNSENQVSCTGGFDHFYVTCGINTSYSDSNIDSLLVTNLLGENVQLISQGVCIDQGLSLFSNYNYNNIQLGQIHELSHFYAISSFPILNSEGLASFFPKVGTRFTPVANGSSMAITCLKDGYRMGSEYFIYQKLTNAAYYTGACFFQDLQLRYDSEKFKNLFKYASTLKKGCYNLFRDVINPTFGENVTALFGNKYSIDESDWDMCI